MSQSLRAWKGGAVAVEAGWAPWGCYLALRLSEKAGLVGLPWPATAHENSHLFVVTAVVAARVLRSDLQRPSESSFAKGSTRFAPSHSGQSHCPGLAAAKQEEVEVPPSLADSARSSAQQDSADSSPAPASAAAPDSPHPYYSPSSPEVAGAAC